ncbi:MAG TPA: hypothetical protein VNK91_01925 [Burkholderiaceae bacterium]|nr:hypothetical protein [Burkholderiaceae bacterium]
MKYLKNRTVQRLVLVAVVAAAAALGYDWTAAGILIVGAILDSQNLYSDAQALTATAVSTNVIDHGATERRLGSGEPMGVLITVDVALAGTTPTFQVTLQSDSADTFPSPATVAQTETFSTLAAGAQIVLPVPPRKATERFTRLNYTLGGTTPTITVTAALMPLSMIPTDAIYPDGFAIT